MSATASLVVATTQPSPPLHCDPTSHSGLDRRRAVGAVVTAGVVAGLYLLFVLHYSINFIFWDEWASVPIVHAALHSHLTFGALWAQHNENRILVPNLLVVLSGLIENYNSKVLIILGASFFIASYGLLLIAFRNYLGRPLTLLHTLTLGIVWFSLEDTENSLWGFQLAWYLVIFLLIALMTLLGRQWRHRNSVLALALLISVAASFSSLQGLILWPMGLVYLLWDRPSDRRRSIECAIWLLVCAFTTAAYFRQFNFTATSATPGFALHHPVGMVKFFLAAVGNVVPTTRPDLPMHELLGLALFVAAAFVVFFSFRERVTRIRTPLPVALILFGILFDGSIVFGRISGGIGAALSTRYTMPNLLLLLGVVTYAWTHVRLDRRRREHRCRFAAVGQVSFALLAVFLVIQSVTATRYGLASGATDRQDRITGARTLVNLDRIPGTQAQQLISSYVYPTAADLAPFLREAEADHLSVFAPAPFRFYRSEGPPPA